MGATGAVRRLFLDSSVLLYAFGGASPQRDACLKVLDAASQRQAQLHLSVEAGQEFLLHRLRRDSRPAALAAFDTLTELVDWHPFDLGVLLRARRLIDTTQVRGRDAIHAATALRAGFDAIVTTDRDFEGIPGLRRIDPSALDPT